MQGPLSIPAAICPSPPAQEHRRHNNVYPKAASPSEWRVHIPQWRWSEDLVRILFLLPAVLSLCTASAGAPLVISQFIIHALFSAFSGFT